MELFLHSVLVFAPDLERARAFYGDALGLQLERSAADFVLFRGPDFKLTVFLCAIPGDATGYSERAGAAVALAVHSLDEAMAELGARGVHFLHSSPSQGPHGRYVAFADPFGTVHELVEVCAA